MVLAKSHLSDTGNQVHFWRYLIKVHKSHCIFKNRE